MTFTIFFSYFSKMTSSLLVSSSTYIPGLWVHLPTPVYFLILYPPHRASSLLSKTYQSLCLEKLSLRILYELPYLLMQILHVTLYF